MLKITIQDNDGAKIYYGTGVQMHRIKVKDLVWYECTIFVQHELVKSGSMLLHPSDTVLIEEIENGDH